MFKFNYFKKYRIAGNTNSILRQFQLCMNFVMLGKGNVGWRNFREFFEDEFLKEKQQLFEKS